jgi:hypothetical protein
MNLSMRIVNLAAVLRTAANYLHIECVKEHKMHWPRGELLRYRHALVEINILNRV